MVLTVRRRVQLFSSLIIIGWIALVMTAWIARGGIATSMLMLTGALISVGLVAFLILEVRRLPSESEVGHLSRYPRRLP